MKNIEIYKKAYNKFISYYGMSKDAARGAANAVMRKINPHVDRAAIKQAFRRYRSRKKKLHKFIDESGTHSSHKFMDLLKELIG